MITKTCLVSGKEFEITESDLDFYRKMEIISEEDYKKLKFREIIDCVGLPTLCPEERQRQRLARRNERALYNSKCDLTGEKGLSVYSPNYKGKVISPYTYWGDSWDPLEYGRNFDFSRSFFEQFYELFLSVPQISLLLKEIDNSKYCNDALRLKNCYLVFDGEQSRDCMYGETFCKITDCLDFLFLEGSELCYECVNCKNGYDLKFSYNCQNCSESWFLRDCVGCKNCFGCSNIRQKQYWIYNKSHSKEEYEQFFEGFHSGKNSFIKKLKENTHNFWNQQVVKYQSGFKNENSTGDHISNCKDSFECFDCNNLRDCKFCTNCLLEMQDCQDINIWGNYTQMCYNCACIGEGVQNSVGCFYLAFGAINISYSTYCWLDVKDLFGCVGLRHKQYCILNKQYTKEEYFKLREKIIEHMKETGEWGEFFPIELSPFAYNETVAQEYFPLTKEEALSRGYKWKDKISRDFRPATIESIPDDIKEVEDSITKEILACEECSKNYQIQKMELKFYRKMNLPIPRKCPDCRHSDRMKLRTPRTLFDRNCSDCQKEIKTTFSPDKSEKVLCEDCYLKVVN